MTEGNILSTKNCKIKTEIDSEFVRRVIQAILKSSEGAELKILTRVLQDLLDDGKVSQAIWFDATNAWAYARKIIDEEDDNEDED